MLLNHEKQNKRINKQVISKRRAIAAIADMDTDHASLSELNSSF